MLSSGGWLSAATAPRASCAGSSALKARRVRSTRALPWSVTCSASRQRSMAWLKALVKAGGLFSEVATGNSSAAESLGALLGLSRPLKTGAQGVFIPLTMLRKHHV